MKLLENTFQPNPNIFFHSMLSILLYLGENYVYLKGGGGCKISHSHLFKLLSVANYKNKMMYFFFCSKTKETEPGSSSLCTAAPPLKKIRLGSSEKFRLLYVMVTP